MKIDKKAAIARRNQQLGSAVLGVNNTHFATINLNKEIWWFDIPVSRLKIGQYEFVHLLLHNHVTDELHHLRVPTLFFRSHEDGLVTRNKGERKATLSLELSADKDSLFQDVRPSGTGVRFAEFVQQ
ncbi:hypothetical protein [Pseudomonas sp. 2FE]|uniref:hypothetical protein n=1 Tax=Pseudomonas sp. 2FE TaxID=2502190 RepID=UPI0010F76D15|nr:hypothetical protein [Pseudomonas sp. 2FE]